MMQEKELEKQFKQLEKKALQDTLRLKLEEQQKKLSKQRARLILVALNAELTWNTSGNK